VGTNNHPLQRRPLTWGVTNFELIEPFISDQITILNFELIKYGLHFNSLLPSALAKGFKYLNNNGFSH